MPRRPTKIGFYLILVPNRVAGVFLQEDARYCDGVVCGTKRYDGLGKTAWLDV